MGDRGDFGRFLEIAADLKLDALGRGPDRFLSYGAYVGEADALFAGGVWDGAAAKVSRLDTARIAEDIACAWLCGADAPRHPSEGITRPLADKPGAYTWCKAPRLAGMTMETGALARQQVHGHALIRALVAASGGNVRNRVVARLLELALVLPRMEHWLREIVAGEAFCSHAAVPVEASGVGLVEAARGSLGHWLRIERGRIHNYQIIAPTTWNFSPRDAAGNPGPLEQALVGTPVDTHEQTPVAVQHVVRSFDPCMVCTVH